MKTKPDIIVTWPRNCDYPLWRAFVHQERQRFNEIIIAFTETHEGHDYREFIRTVMYDDHVHFIDPRPLSSTEDWRNVAVNASLMYSYNAEWIWFTEQDFFVTEPSQFWTWTERHDTLDVVGIKDDNRLHPCCLFMKRDALNKTCRNFGIVPDKLDHFGLIQKDIERLELKTHIINPAYYEHLAGFSSNWTLLARGQQPNYQIDTFKRYIIASLNVPVPIDARYKKIAQALL